MPSPHRPSITTLGLLASALVLAAPARAGSITGSASLRERIALPPDAVFEAVLIDMAIADAPARELGRVRLEPAGQPPFRFAIPYRDSDLSSRGRYAVRATVRQGERLLFTTDTINPVLSGGPQAGPQPPVTLQLVQVGGSRPGGGQGSLGRLPASWRGDLPAGGGSTRWQVDLAADGSFQLRQTQLRQGSGQSSHDDIGRWRLEPGGNRLVLQGGREAPVFLEPLDQGKALRKLSLEGQPLPSGANDRLQRLALPEPIEPRLHLAGMFRYMADAASIRLCATGASLPVAMEGDYLALERAYLAARPAHAPGQPLLVNLEGLITSRPSAEPGRGPLRTLVVERFVGVHPGRSCPQQASASPGATGSWPALRGQLWQLQALQDGEGPTLLTAPGRPPQLQLATDSTRVSGSGGCNRLMAGAVIKGETIRFSRLASTQKACAEAVMAFERRYGQALERVRRWSIDRRTLLLQDERGRTLLVFQPSM
ncbi:MAG: META domain-containing protein [Cyanobium sp. M30B3]|nr:MAG: META domain-containing protein [Cyanobium sp. M30B3]